MRALAGLRVVWGLLLAGALIVLVALVTPDRGDRAGAGLALAPWVVLFVAAPVGILLRGQIYKRYWRGDVVTGRGYVAGNMVLFAGLGAIVITCLIASLAGAPRVATILPGLLATALILVNHPHGHPLQPPT